jgi:mRNA-degrading endonuclease YafQ of YafQ-DinJ toxin-antitoxin module
MRVLYKPSFVRQYQKLEPALKDDVTQSIDEFKDSRNHKKLKVHRLKGPLAGFYSFSVNYRFRIVFTFSKRASVAELHAVGDHDVYR